MTTFQVSALTVFALLLGITLTNLVRRRGRLQVSSLWSLVWIGGAVVTLRPDFTRVVANLFGIGRGADLVLYVGLILTAIGFFVVYVRIRRLRQNVTQLTRELAIARARVPQASVPPQSVPPPGN